MITNKIKEHSTQIQFENKVLFKHICGIADVGVNKLEKMLDLKIIPRGHHFLLQSTDLKKINKARHFFESLISTYNSDEPMPEEFDLVYLLKKLGNNKMTNQALPTEKNNKSKGIYKEIITNSFGQKVYPRTHKQNDFVESINNNEVTICTGPAGTGKTFLSTAVACRMFKKGIIDRIVLTRPAVEAGESLGFLPGDLSQKVDPYLRPLYDALYECLGYEKTNDLISLRKIEVAPLAFMRGRSLNHSFIILDEAQNCTLSQLKMFLTRLGQKSRMCISGDNTQIDLTPGKSGLVESGRILKDIEGIGLIQFGPEDIIRNPLVEKIVQAFLNSNT